jgi:UDP-N-acetylglucosamine 1-carboxyvinyltransferase
LSSIEFYAYYIEQFDLIFYQTVRLYENSSKTRALPYRGIEMSKLLIEGSRKLEGIIRIHGAKNSILPILAATILCQGNCVIHNCPILSDVYASIDILEYLGADVRIENHDIIVNTQNIYKYDIPDFLMREMRSSVIFLGAIIGRLKQAKISLPGGCEIGPRPIDLHLESMKQM